MQRFSRSAKQENGWLPATAFANGGAETRQEYGGGICQVSTTLYNAVLRSDLEIIARSGHTRKVRYIGGGLDAALSGKDKDFVFRNNTDSDIYVFMWVDESQKLCVVKYTAVLFRRISTEWTPFRNLHLQLLLPNLSSFLIQNLNPANVF